MATRENIGTIDKAIAPCISVTLSRFENIKYSSNMRGKIINPPSTLSQKIRLFLSCSLSEES